MTEDEIRAFLTRWVMEVGNGTVFWDDEHHCYSSHWYGHQCIGADTKHMAQYFTLDHSERGGAAVRITINQAGLDFIKGEENAKP